MDEISTTKVYCGHLVESHALICVAEHHPIYPLNHVYIKSEIVTKAIALQERSLIDVYLDILKEQ